MRAHLAILGLCIGLCICACYDVDSLRAGRNEPVVPSDAGVIGDGGPNADAAEASADAAVDGATTCPPTAPSDALLAFYPLDEPSGNLVTDCSGRALDGVIIGTAAWTAGHKAGGLRLSPSTGCVQLGSATSASSLDFTGAFSVTTWLNVSSFPGATSAGYIVSKTRDPDLGGWRLGTEVGGMVGGVITLPGNMRLTVSTAIPTAVWVHVALVVVPGGEATLYVDGAFRKSTPGVPAVLLPDKTATARIGCRSDGSSALDGIVDDLHVYGRALSATEIATLAQ